MINGHRHLPGIGKKLAKIRSLVVSQVQLTHKGKSENYLINEEHKI